MYDNLVEQLKYTQATLFSFMVKAWNFHWNVTGPHFSEYHEFFGKVYADTIPDIDMISEHIRICDAMAPGALSKFMEVTQIKDNLVPMTSSEMLDQLARDVDIILGELEDVQTIAEDVNKIGIMADAEALIAKYDKLSWMIRSFK